MTPATKIDRAVLRGNIEAMIAASPWAADVPEVPDAPLYAYGTLAWARLVLALLDETEAEAAPD